MQTIERKKLRLQLIGDKRFQWHTIILILSTIMLSGLLVLITAVTVIVRYNVIINPEYPVSWHLINTIILASSVTLLSCLVLALMTTLIYANKIAGPLYRLKQYLYDMINGEFDAPIKFRTDDEFKDLTVAVNTFREKMIAVNALARK